MQTRFRERCGKYQGYSGPNTQNRSVEIQSFTFDDKGSYKVEYDTELLSGDTDPQITEEKFFEKPLLAPLVSE